MIALVGNKLELEAEREVTTGEGQQLANDTAVLFFETSPKTGHNIENLFTQIAEKLPKSPPMHFHHHHHHPAIEIEASPRQKAPASAGRRRRRWTCCEDVVDDDDIMEDLPPQRLQSRSWCPCSSSSSSTHIDHDIWSMIARICRRCECEDCGGCDCDCDVDTFDD